MHTGAARRERAPESEERQPASGEWPAAEREQDTVENYHQAGERAAMLQSWVGSVC